MTVPTTDLDEYHVAIQKLQTEIEKYGDAASTLQYVSSSLLRTQQANAAAAKSLVSFAQGSESSLKALSSEVSDTLVAIRDLKLEELHADTQSRYEAHQARLDQLGKAVEDAVREQQRLGLEMLQHTTALQQELTRYSNQVEQTTRAIAERQATTEGQLRGLEHTANTISAQLSTTDKQLQRLGNVTDAIAHQLNGTDATVEILLRQVALAKTLLFVTIALVIIVGVLSVTV